jgi:RNA polymerase sigma factor (sigma-70 family)
MTGAALCVSGANRGKRYGPLPPLTADQAALVERHLEWARRGASKYAARYASQAGFDDFASAAYWGLVMAAQRFDPGRGLVFKTYAMPWTESQLRRVLYERRRACGSHFRNGRLTAGLRRLDLAVDDPVLSGIAELRVDSRLDDALLLEQARARLRRAARSTREQRIVAGRLAGASIRELARDLGLSHRSVLKAWAGIRQRALDTSSCHWPCVAAGEREDT